MSILKSIVKGITGVGKTLLGGAVGTAIGGPIGGIIGGAMSSSGAKLAAKGVAGALTVMPGVGRVASAALPVLAGAGAGMLYDQMGRPVAQRRRRRKGITPKDLSSFKRVARLIDKYAAPVHKLRKSSFKPHAH